MAVVIRLQRTGKPKNAHYRVVAMDKKNPVRGEAIEILGHYHPVGELKPADELVLNMDRINYWLGVGAQPTRTVGSLLARAKKAS